ncbi:MAG: hypothetical protein Hens3KO_18230 [Henriciella sp.]
MLRDRVHPKDSDQFLLINTGNRTPIDRNTKARVGRADIKAKNSGQNATINFIKARLMPRKIAEHYKGLGIKIDIARN